MFHKLIKMSLNVIVIDFHLHLRFVKLKEKWEQNVTLLVKHCIDCV